VACLQCVPQITITNGIPTTFIPLGIVLGFDGVVTALEDYKRHVNDARANSSTSACREPRQIYQRMRARTTLQPALAYSPARASLSARAALVMREGRFQKVAWRDIRVGDLMKIMRNETVPADCVFLSACSPDAGTPDACYVQTAQLDGETNLKLKQAIAPTVAYFRTWEDCARFRGFVLCEPPSLVSFFNQRQLNSRSALSRLTVVSPPKTISTYPVYDTPTAGVNVYS
jgi:hypothetical protein